MADFPGISWYRKFPDLCPLLPVVVSRMCGYFSIKVTEVVLMGPGAEELQLSRHAWFEVTRLVLKTGIQLHPTVGVMGLPVLPLLGMSKLDFTKGNRVLLLTRFVFG